MITIQPSLSPEVGPSNRRVKLSEEVGSGGGILSNDFAVPPMRIGKQDLTAHRAPLPALTGIRFFAAMLVVFYHSKMADVLLSHGWPFAANLIANGQLAVPLFFTLSGFILSYTYEGQIASEKGPQRFWEARVARVWPLYLFSLLCNTVVNHTTPTFLRAVATVLMLQSWHPWDKEVASSWNYVCWTLSAEAFFYLLFPWIQRVLERRSSMVQATVWVVSLTLSVYYRTAPISYKDGNILGAVPLAVIHLPVFLSGVCAGNLFLRWKAAVREQRVSRSRFLDRGPLTWAALLLSIFLLCHLSRAYTAWTAVSFAALLFGLAAEPSLVRRLLSTRLLIIGGQISYGIYLLQWPCKTAVIRVCTLLDLNSANLRFVIDCVLVILFSLLCFYGIEEPARRVLRHGFARLQRRRALSLQTHLDYGS